MVREEVTPREEQAIYYYLDGHTEADALRLAGYAEGTATGNPHTVFHRPRVRAEIERRQARLREKMELDEEWAVQRMMRLADAGRALAKFKKVQDDGTLKWDFRGATEDELALIDELTVTTFSTPGGGLRHKMKIGHGDPLGALNSLFRKLGLFEDKLKISGGVSLVERIQRGRARAGEGSDGEEKDDKS